MSHRNVVVAFCIAGVCGHAAESTSWIEELGGKVTQDREGNVATVNLRGSWIYDSQMIELARMSKLEKLDLSHTRISDEGMAYLKPAAGITDLNLYYAEQITDQGINAIKDWKHLKRLNLRGTRVSDGAAETISRLTGLESLDLSNTPITDNGLDPLVTLVSLKELSLGHRRESHNQVELLQLLPTLTHLNLSGPSGAERPDAAYRRDIESGPMHSDLVRAIAGLKQLRVLRLGYSNIDSDGLRALSVLGDVEQLGLESCSRIDDDAVAQLAGWKALRQVDLQETKVTEKGVAALRKAHPGIRILVTGHR